MREHEWVKDGLAKGWWWCKRCEIEVRREKTFIKDLYWYTGEPCNCEEQEKINKSHSWERTDGKYICRKCGIIQTHKPFSLYDCDKMVMKMALE